MRFTALEDFYSPELKSSYVKGLSYTVRPGDVLLVKLVPTWIDEGKVELGGPEAKIEGSD